MSTPPTPTIICQLWKCGVVIIMNLFWSSTSLISSTRNWECWPQLQPRGQNTGETARTHSPWDRALSERGLHFIFRFIQLSSLNIFGILRARGSVMSQSGLLRSQISKFPVCLVLIWGFVNISASHQGGHAGSSSSICTLKVAWSIWQEERPSFWSSPTFSESPQEVD